MAVDDETLSVAARILTTARQLHEAGVHEAAVVAAQSACEVACEWAIARLLLRRGAGYLHKCLDEMVGSYNLTGRVCHLYVALSGDRVQDQPFWAKLTECVKLRNRVVHDGQTVSAEWAARHLEVAQHVIRHLEQRCGEMRLPGSAVESGQTAVLTSPIAHGPTTELPLQ